MIENRSLNNIETIFNIAGSTPFVAVLSGSVRSLAGAVQAFAGMYFGAKGILGMFFFSKSKNCEPLVVTGFSHTAHGGLNFLRGIIEHILGLTLIGSVALLMYQLNSDNKFQPLYPYKNNSPESKLI